MTKTIFTTFVRVLGVVALFACATTDTAVAKTITKSFEFGTGTLQTHSNVRTFPVPCGLAVEARVKFQRHGPDSADSDIPIKIDLRKPDTGTDQEGPIAETESAFAKRGQQTLVLNGAKLARGCPLPWRVRVRYADEGVAPFTVYGSIDVTFNDGVQDIPVNVYSYILSKNLIGNPTTLNFGSSSGLTEGTVKITGTWIHFVAQLRAIGLPGPYPVKLKFELIDPGGTVVASNEGYSNAETGDYANRKMKIVFRVPDCRSGQWKIRITNIDEAGSDAIDIATKATLTPDCP